MDVFIASLNPVIENYSTSCTKSLAFMDEIVQGLFIFNDGVVMILKRQDSAALQFQSNCLFIPHSLHINNRFDLLAISIGEITSYNNA
jgi:sulfur relay (sulfurtransferase) DsrF/TusC family protein